MLLDDQMYEIYLGRPPEQVRRTASGELDCSTSIRTFDGDRAVLTRVPCFGTECHSIVTSIGNLDSLAEGDRVGECSGRIYIDPTDCQKKARALIPNAPPPGPSEQVFRCELNRADCTAFFRFLVEEYNATDPTREKPPTTGWFTD